jgi:hypothetical protein
MNKPVFNILAFVFMLSGLTFGGIAAWLYLQENGINTNKQTAQGTVIEMDASRDSEGSVSYAPIVRFSATNGRTYEIQTSTYSSPAAYQVGEKVTIIYPADQPENAMIKGQNNLIILIFALLSAIELSVAAFVGLKIVNQNIQGQA